MSSVYFFFELLFLSWVTPTNLIYDFLFLLFSLLEDRAAFDYFVFELISLRVLSLLALIV